MDDKLKISHLFDVVETSAVHQKYMLSFHGMKMSLRSDCLTHNYISQTPLHPGKHSLITSSLQWSVSENDGRYLHAKVIKRLMETLFCLFSFSPTICSNV